MDRKQDPFNYFTFLGNAIKVASLRARQDGVRYRVHRVKWNPPRGAKATRWYIAPTPAPGPSGVAVEPCS